MIIWAFRVRRICAHTNSCTSARNRIIRSALRLAMGHAPSDHGVHQLRVDHFSDIHHGRRGEDPSCTWLENLLLHEYTECYLYYSFYQDEPDANVKSVWELHLQHEIVHLHQAVELLRKYENKDWQQFIPGGNFPKLLHFHDTRDYVRQILGQQILLTANREQYVPVPELPADHAFFFYQNKVNHDVNAVDSHCVIAHHQQKYNVDYRAEEKTNPVQELTDRTMDNVTIAR